MDDQEFNDAVQAALDRNKAAIMGKHKNVLDALLRIPGEQLSMIVPDVSATETYNNLISIVKEASRANVQQAELENKIIALGNDAIKIAKLAGLFV